jgi:hypothetical protein
VESSCEFDIEPSGSINAGKPSSVQTTRDISSSAQLYGVSYYFIFVRETEMEESSVNAV